MASGTLTALITGGTSGIGRATANKLAQLGIHVSVSGRNTERGNRTVQEIHAAGGKADFIASDLTDAHQRKFDVVAVWKIDRFGRSLHHLVNALAELEGRGIAFVSLRDNLHLSTPSGRLMFQIIGAMAEFERSLIQERVRAGLRNARTKGKRLGRPRVVCRCIQEIDSGLGRTVEAHP